MTDYDLIIRDGLIYDGTGADPVPVDLAVQGDRIAAVGRLNGASARREVRVDGLAIAPGFINMLSWAVESLIEDGRAQSDIRQGVTLEVMGEALSWGPLNDRLRDYLIRTQGDIKYDITWDTLGEYLHFLEKRGVSPNITSFVGATTIRACVLGFDDVQPTPEQLAEMQSLVRYAMQEGAVGLSTALIYPPGSYAKTTELVALCEAVAEYDGLYISHLRSEGANIFPALDEFFNVLRESGARGEIYHLKLAGQSNWDKLDDLIARIEAAQSSGLAVTADMYTYPAAGTGLNSIIPPWAHDGGHEALIERIKDPETRARIKQDMALLSDDWENLYAEAGSAENIMPVYFKNPDLRRFAGNTLAEIATLREQSPEDAVLDLIIEDDSRVGTIYFLMAEDNLRRQVTLPWMSFGSDASAPATEGVFIKTPNHPRAYGTFARVLGKYVRDAGLMPLQDAIRRLTSLPAQTLKIRDRGLLAPGYFADIVVFDPEAVQDHATFTDPHQYSTGMVHVFVNGEQVLEDGEHTGALPGRVVHGPGWTGWR